MKIKIVVIAAALLMGANAFAVKKPKPKPKPQPIAVHKALSCEVFALKSLTNKKGAMVQIEEQMALIPLKKRAFVIGLKAVGKGTYEGVNTFVNKKSGEEIEISGFVKSKKGTLNIEVLYSNSESATVYLGVNDSQLSIRTVRIPLPGAGLLSCQLVSQKKASSAKPKPIVQK